MAMNTKNREFRDDPTESERRKNLNEAQIEDAYHTMREFMLKYLEAK